MADIKIYGKLVANTEDQVVADASSIQDTARNQKLSETLNELAQGTGLKVLELNLNNYLSQDGLLALIQGINYASVGDAISYQLTSSVAVDSSYNAVHVTASVSGQGGIDLYLLKSINEKFSCETLVSDGYSSKYKTIQHATLITSSGYIRGITITNSYVGNLCDLVNGRYELTSTKLTYWFPVGILPTHIKLANDIIIDLQGDEYCAIGSETIDAEISNSVFLNVVKIDINGDFSSVSANDVKVVDFLWHHIENPSNFSFDDLPRWSVASDIDTSGGGSGGGAGGSGKLYEFKFELTTHYLGDNDTPTTETKPISFLIYESNFERLKDLASGLNITINTPQDLITLINTTLNETEQSNDSGVFTLFYNLAQAMDKIVVWFYGSLGFLLEETVRMSPFGFVGDGAPTDFPMNDDTQQPVVYYGLNVNNSCTLTEYGTSASGGTVEAEPIVSIKMTNLDLRYVDEYEENIANAQFYCTKERWDNFVTLAKQEYDVDVTYANFDAVFKALNVEIQNFALGYLLMGYYDGKVLPKSYLYFDVGDGLQNFYYCSGGNTIQNTLTNNIKIIVDAAFGNFALPNSNRSSVPYTTANTVITVEEIEGASIGSSSGNVDLSNLQVGHLTFSNNKNNGIKSLGSIWSVLSLEFYTQYETYKFYAKYMCSEEEMYDLMNEQLDTYRQQGLTIPTVTDHTTLTSAFNIVVDTLFALDSSSAGLQFAGAIVTMFGPSVYGPIQSFMKDAGTTLFTIFRTGDDFGMYAMSDQGSVMNILQTLVTDIGTTKPTNLSVWIND